MEIASPPMTPLFVIILGLVLCLTHVCLLNDRGHGTLDMGRNVIATVCGVVERVNKLVYVRSLRARFSVFFFFNFAD